MTCGDVQQQMTAVLAEAGERRERLEVEAHAERCARCATAYADLIAVSVAVDRAYAPLRATSVTLSPARVRLALRRPDAVPTSVRLGRLSARFTEVALAAAVTAFAFVGSASVAPTPAIVEETTVEAPAATSTTSAEGATIIRWFRIGRYAVTPDVVEPAVARPSRGDVVTQPGLHDRATLQR